MVREGPDQQADGAQRSPLVGMAARLGEWQYGPWKFRAWEFGHGLRGYSHGARAEVRTSALPRWVPGERHEERFDSRRPRRLTGGG